MDRMGPLDALFLDAEDGNTHLHIGSCAIFAGPAPAFEDMTRLIESKLPLLVRYRQKVRFVPGGLGLPVWVDDPAFDLSAHVHHAALPAPGGEQDLDDLMARLMSYELDRGRPLWDVWLVEGLPSQRWALISKVHHCMVDGVSGTDLMAALLDRDRTSGIPTITQWRPNPEPTELELVVDALARLALEPPRRLATWVANGASPRRAWREIRDVAAGARSLAARLRAPARPVSVEGAIGAHRRWATARCSLEDVKEIRDTFGGSVNDVVLSAISGAFRRVLLERGDPVDRVMLRSLVPVSVREPDDHTSNNQVSMMIAELPVDIADPVERLHAVCRQMEELKASHQVEAGAALFKAAELLPPAVFTAAIRSASTLMRRVPQRMIHTVTTNVRGPSFPLYALGLEMLEYLPFVPLSEGVRIGVAILSYNGRIAFGITGDYATVRDVQFMAHRIEAEILDLRERADVHRLAPTAVAGG